MTRTFSNGPSLHSLITNAPIDALLRLFSEVEDCAAADTIRDLAAPGPHARAAESEQRQHLLDRFGEIGADLATRLDNLARRIMALGENRGIEALSRIAEADLSREELIAFDAQQDGYGRSIWMFLRPGRLFDDAESFFHATHYRNCGKVSEAFEITGDDGGRFEWCNDLKDALERAITDALDLRGDCSVTHLLVAEPGAEGTEQRSHVIIVRHAGPLSSVAEHLEGGRKGTHYYRPPNEATLIYLPAQGLVEVCSASPGVRQKIASCFAATGLHLDLSSRPVTLKQYNLSRFFQDRALPLPPVDGVDIEQAAVVDLEVIPENPRHRVAFRVTADDDIDAEVNGVFGAANVFRQAAAISRVVIAVRYASPGRRRSRTLNITLSHPNKCNLRSNRDPVERELGYSLLESWGILKPLQPLSAEDERALLPVLLDLYDMQADEVTASQLRRRGLDIDALAARGFIERRGRHQLALIDDDDQGRDAVEVFSLGRQGELAFEGPADALNVAVCPDLFERYRIRDGWVAEVVLGQIGKALADSAPVRLDACLTFLGRIAVGDETVPCYLARGLADPKVVGRVDGLLRGRSHDGVGLVLSTGDEALLNLGPNVVARLREHLAPAESGPLLSMDGLAACFQQNRVRALGGMAVELIRSAPQVATLYVPGRTPLALMGAVRIRIFERLVEAHRKGSPAVPTKTLLDGLKLTSPSQAFRPAQWKEIVDVHIGQKGQRGSWQLLA